MAPRKAQVKEDSVTVTENVAAQEDSVTVTENVAVQEDSVTVTEKRVLRVKVVSQYPLVCVDTKSALQPNSVHDLKLTSWLESQLKAKLLKEVE